MILGIGSDLIDIRRIETALEKYGQRFTLRVFTDEERARAAQHRGRASILAKRWAAKEACAKALGTGVKKGVYLKDMGVVNLASGAPTLELTGGAAALLASMVPEGLSPRVHLTMTDDYPMAQAFVVIEAV